jgi:hypothetical protein
VGITITIMVILMATVATQDQKLIPTQKSAHSPMILLQDQHADTGHRLTLC